MSEPVFTYMWKYLPFVFTFSLVFVGVFSVNISDPPLSTGVSSSFTTFILVSALLLDVIFSFSTGACLTEGWAIIFPWYAVFAYNFVFVCAVYSFVRLLVILFFINSRCCTKYIHVSTVKLTLWSVSNNLCFNAWSCLPSIKRRMINSSSAAISPVLSLSYSQYLTHSFNRCTDCTID